jgi:hypothetical protein
MKSKTLNIYLPYLFLILVVLSTVVLRMRLLDVPLERDEGEYAYMGQLILDGIPPYTEAYNMKFPGIYFIFAGILWLFGETHTAIHCCLLIVNIFSIILLFIFARKAYDGWVAAAAACAFSLLSMSYHVQGFWANAEHFILPFVIGANLLLLSGLQGKKIKYMFFSGFLFGCAALVKQQGAFFGLFGFAVMILLIWQDKTFNKKMRWNNGVVFISGVLVPLLLCLSYLAYTGVLEKFYLWTFVYAKEYSSISSINDIKFNFIGGFQSLFYFSSPIWMIGGIGLISLLVRKEDNVSRLITCGFLIAGIVALSIGFYFRSHYFVLVLPALALLFGIGIRFVYKLFSAASSSIVRYLPPTITVLAALLGTLMAHWDVLVQFSLPHVTETVYHNNPFPFSLRVAELIKDKTTKDDRIAILGNEPQFLFYSQRKSATSFIYIFSLVEEQPFAAQFRNEMMHQVESASPKVLVFCHVLSESYKKPSVWQNLDNWFLNYASLQYTLTARFEYLNSNDTVLVTDPVDRKSVV